MLKNVLISLAVGTIPLIVKTVTIYTNRLVLFFSKSRSGNRAFNWKLQFDLKDEVLTIFVFAALYFLLLYGGHFIGSSSVYGQYIVAILFLTLLTSYNFLIRPFVRTAMSDKYQTHEDLEHWINNHSTKTIKLQVINDDIKNAYAGGVLPFTQTIMLGQPLFEEMGEKDRKSVALHELGHLQNNHMLLLFVTALLNSTVFVFAFSYAVNYIIPALHVWGSDYLVVAVTSGLLGLYQFYSRGAVQRLLEYRADLFAAKSIGTKQYARALTRLHEIIGIKPRKSNIDHPSLEKRIAYVEKHC